MATTPRGPTHTPDYSDLIARWLLSRGANNPETALDGDYYCESDQSAEVVMEALQRGDRRQERYIIYLAFRHLQGTRAPVLSGMNLLKEDAPPERAHFAIQNNLGPKRTEEFFQWARVDIANALYNQRHGQT